MLNSTRLFDEDCEDEAVREPRGGPGCRSRSCRSAGCDRRPVSRMPAFTFSLQDVLAEGAVRGVLEHDALAEVEHHAACDGDARSAGRVDADVRGAAHHGLVRAVERHVVGRDDDGPTVVGRERRIRGDLEGLEPERGDLLEARSARRKCRDARRLPAAARPTSGRRPATATPTVKVGVRIWKMLGGRTGALRARRSSTIRPAGVALSAVPLRVRTELPPLGGPRSAAVVPFPSASIVRFQSRMSAAVRTPSLPFVSIVPVILPGPTVRSTV